jgi:hypothetical protein
MGIDHKISGSGYYIELYPENLSDVTPVAVLDKIMSIIDNDLVLEREADSHGRDVVRLLRTPTLVLNGSMGLSGYSLWKFIFNFLIEVYGDVESSRKVLFDFLDGLYERYSIQGFFPNYDDKYGEFDISTSVFTAIFSEEISFSILGNDTKSKIAECFDNHFYMWDLDFEHPHTNRIVEKVLSFYLSSPDFEKYRYKYLYMLGYRLFNGLDGPHPFQYYYGPLTKNLINLYTLRGIDLRNFLDFVFREVKNANSDQESITHICSHVYGNRSDLIAQFFETYTGEKYQEHEFSSALSDVKIIGGQVDLLAFDKYKNSFFIGPNARKFSTGVHEYDSNTKEWSLI